MQLKLPLAPLGSLELAKIAGTTVIGLLERDTQEIRPVMFHLFSLPFWTLSQMDTCDKSEGFRKRSMWCGTLVTL